MAIEYAKIFQKELDKQMTGALTTGWMELNSKLVKYNGGNEVKIPSILMDGLGDYDRVKGHVSGSVNLTWETHKLTQDRGREFLLDAMDVDESNFVATAGVVMGEFQRTKVVPEIDAYRYSKIADLAIAAGKTKAAAITKDNVIDELLAAITAIEEEVGTGAELVITMSPTIAGILASATNSKNYMSTGELKKGEMSVKVNTFNDSAIVKAPQKLLQTAFVFNDGVTGGQEAGGFTVDGSAKAINFIVAAKDAPVAISKTDKVRTFDPSTYQNANAWKMDYRKYHDLWIPKNKLAKVFVHTV